METGHEVRELSLIAGRRHCDVPQVELDVEVGVFDPVRPVESERYRHEPAAKGFELVEPVDDQLLQGVEGDRLRRGVEHGEETDVAVKPSGFPC